MGRLYTGFVSQLIEYVEAQGKTAMLWGDIVLNHMELLPEISEKAVLLNWDYSPEPDFSKVKCFEETERTQIVCPGTSGWGRLAEYLPWAADNIRSMALYGKLCHAGGFLNTNWGDNGHLCDPLNAAYGMVLGAAEAWNPGGASEDYFDQAVGILNYHNDNGNAVRALKMINQSDDIDVCTQALNLYGEKRYEGYSFQKEMYGWKELLDRAKQCEQAGKLLKQEAARGNMEPNTAKALMLAAEGYALLLRGLASVCGSREAFCEADFERWLTGFRENWTAQNRKDELPVALEVLRGFRDRVVTEREARY